MRRSVIDFYFKHFSVGDYTLGLTNDEANFMEIVLETHGYASSKVKIAKGEYQGQWAVKCLGAKPDVEPIPAPIYLTNVIEDN